MFVDAFTAFIHGLKPAYACAYERFPEQREQLTAKGFPYVRLPRFDLFFESAVLRDRFLTRSRGLDFHEPAFKRVLGEALGYPPAATRFYESFWPDRDHMAQYVAEFNYAGRQFFAHIDDVEEVAEWLWEHVPVPPEPVQYEYQGQTFTLTSDVSYTSS
jgi:hypothetical protein